MADIDHDRESVLEDWGRRCAEAARELAGYDLRWDVKGGFSHFPCPNPDGDHDWKGNDPQGWAVLTAGGAIKAGCRKCAPQGSTDKVLAVYTAGVKEIIGWSDDAVEKKASTVEVLRSHEYETMDGQFIIAHRKLKKKHGNAQPYWGFSWKPTAEGRMGYWRHCGRGDLVKLQAEHYSSFKSSYHMLKLYKHRRFEKPDGDGVLKDVYRTAVCEGEKDAETFNELMVEIKGSVIATALPSQQVTSLAPHQLRVFEGREVILLPDQDQGGKRFAESWSDSLWETAGKIKVVDASLYGNHGDLTEWVEAEMQAGKTRKEIGDELMKAMVETSPLEAPMTESRFWKQRLRKTQKGGYAAGNIYNGELVWTMHPELRTKVRYNVVTGDYEVVMAPWLADPMETDTGGARHLGNACAAWLDKQDEVALMPKMLETALTLPNVASNYIPTEELLGAVWDGIPRVDRFCSDYIPINALPSQAVALSRVLIGDLVAKLRGDLRPQRILLAVETVLGGDIAAALAGTYGNVHNGRIHDPATFVENGIMAVHLSMEAVGHRNIGPHNTPHVFAARTTNRTSRKAGPSPWYIASGIMPHQGVALREVNEKVYLLALAKGYTMRIDALAEDAPQILAEGLERIEELLAAVPPTKESLQTLDDKALVESIYPMVVTLHTFLTRDVPLQLMADPEIEYAVLAEPRRHIVRAQFFKVMRGRLLLEWRRESEWIRAFNLVIRHFGLPSRVSLTPNIASKLGLHGLFQNSSSPTSQLGTYVSPGSLETISAHVAGDNPLENPKATPESLNDSNGYTVIPSRKGYEGRETIRPNRIDSLASRHALDKKKERTDFRIGNRNYLLAELAAAIDTERLFGDPPFRVEAYDVAAVHAALAKAGIADEVEVVELGDG